MRGSPLKTLSLILILSKDEETVSRFPRVLLSGVCRIAAAIIPERRSLIRDREN